MGLLWHSQELSMWTGLLAVFATFELPFPNPMPTNDISLFHRALYQDCQDMNNDTLAYDFLEGPQKLLLSNKLGRDFVRTVTSTLSDGNSVYWSARTNYIDSKIASWLAADPSIEQVVLVASGFDSRPYRLQAPPLTLLTPHQASTLGPTASKRPTLTSSRWTSRRWWRRSRRG